MSSSAQDDNPVVRPAVAAAMALLPVSTVLVLLSDGPLWVGLVSWAFVAVLLVPIALLIDTLRTRRRS